MKRVSKLIIYGLVIVGIAIAIITTNIGSVAKKIIDRKTR